MAENDIGTGLVEVTASLSLALQQIQPTEDESDVTTDTVMIYDVTQEHGQFARSINVSVVKR